MAAPFAVVVVWLGLVMNQRSLGWLVWLPSLAVAWAGWPPPRHGTTYVQHLKKNSSIYSML